ncbi:MAG: bifunctional folylpolyglutamate synthase/dihydrofolate synthase, partial [Pyrinomonadaceae bacterium]
GDPQYNYLKVQVAGTNGKGSVCAFLDSICLQAGIKTGVFTSPHLVSITERLRIDGVDISENEFARLASHVRKLAEALVAKGNLDTVPTYFEQVTAIALVAFADAKVDLAILETGLGGRYDAVTAANAEIAAITRIDLDHQEYLGETIEEIAAEKAAIITNETSDVVIGAQTSPVMRLLRKHCGEIGIEPINDRYDPWVVIEDEVGTVKVDLTLSVFKDVRLGLVGKHQIENAQTAVQVTEALKLNGLFAGTESEALENDILKGLKNARHPGRLERIGNILLDGAHNVGGAKALAAYLDEYVTEPITLVFGAMRDKDVAKIADILFLRAAIIILTEPANSRAMSVEELSKFVPAEISRDNLKWIKNMRDALLEAKSSTADKGIILVTGSLYLVGEAKRQIEQKDKI